MSIEVRWRRVRFMIERDETYITEVREHSPTEVRVTVRRDGDNVTEVFAVNAKTRDNARIVADEVDAAIMNAQVAAA